MNEQAATIGYRPDTPPAEQALADQWIRLHLGDLSMWLEELLSRSEHVNYLGQLSAEELDLIAYMTLLGLREKAHRGMLSLTDTPAEALDANEHYTEFIVTAKKWITTHKR